jgi:hypothetical protein
MNPDNKEKPLKRKSRLSSVKRQEFKAKKKLLQELSSFYEKTQTIHLDKDVILGALLHLSESANDLPTLEKFKAKGQAYQKKLSVKHPIVVTLKEPPSLSIKSQMKDLKFKWNSFRKEFYGFGDLDTIKAELTNLDCSIDVVEVV